MKIVDSLLNRSEEIVFRELQSIAADNNLKVFSQKRASPTLLRKAVPFLPSANLISTRAAILISS